MRKNIFIILFTILLPAINTTAQNIYRQRINLAGDWTITADKPSDGKQAENMSGTVFLPGTTDTNRKGMANEKKDETTHLSRMYSYTGKAAYSRDIEIPDRWKGKNIFLHLERTKPTNIFIDGKEAGHSDDISTEQVFNITEYLKPGKHNIRIVVDNSHDAVPQQLISSSHAYTEDTQTNWNGIIGNMYIEAINPLYVSNIDIIPSAADKELQITTTITGNIKKNATLRLILIPWGEDYGFIIAEKELRKAKESQQRIKVIYRNDTLKLWNEFNPNLYRVVAEISGHDAAEKATGLCDFTAKDKHFTVNGRTTFLRGKHDACVFPYTGHVPMNIEAWRRYFTICKGYGINHVRFHSWCPPEACFIAADIEGIYLQPELPFWGDFNKSDTRLMTFLHKEGINIIRKYGHHPSFVMFALGNELWGDIPTMQRFVNDFRKADCRKLYTLGSNFYLGYKGWQDGMDFLVTCRDGGEAWGKYNTHTRGSFSFADAKDGGILNHFYPNSSVTLDEGCSVSPGPVVSHETGQFQTFPDFNEINKYTGVLRPYNMEVFRSRLEKAGMADQATDFHRASGAWSTLLYKADIELDLRTRSMAGFQLLDLQDYPGQGSAYVGILDAFMEPKGLITPEEWRGFCSPVVPLFITDRFCYTYGEPISGRIQLANYGSGEDDMKCVDGKIEWTLKTGDGQTIKSGIMTIPDNNGGLIDIDSIEIDIPQSDKARRLDLTLNACCNTLSTKRYTNKYTLWIYPAANSTQNLHKDIIIARNISDEIGKKLQNGASVLLMPDTAQMRQQTVGALFQTDYWNYRMFKTICENGKKEVSPGTLGLLTNPKHPIFRDFPTEEHTNWQWFPIIKSSRPFILDNTPSTYRPIVQVIDNVERNHKLGLIFEFAVGKGRILVCMSDLTSVQQYPEARCLYTSILKYMKSDDFRPQTAIALETLKKLLTTEAAERRIGELNNISFF